MINTARYIGLIVATFPELKQHPNYQESFVEESGIYVKTHFFVDFANSAIARGDWDLVRRCYALILRIFEGEPDDQVYNAVCVSFIEHLDFTSDPLRGSQAKKMLPARLLEEWKSLEAYWQSQAKQKK